MSAIVMAADPPRNRLLGDFFWSQEAYRVRRRARMPVYLVTEDGYLSRPPERGSRQPRSD